MSLKEAVEELPKPKADDLNSCNHNHDNEIGNMIITIPFTKLSKNSCAPLQKDTLTTTNERRKIGCLKLLSNLFFLLGGLFYTTTALWDVKYCQDSLKYDDDASDDSYFFYKYITLPGIPYFTVYLFVYVLAAFSYFINAIFDLKLAKIYKMTDMDFSLGEGSFDNTTVAESLSSEQYPEDYALELSQPIFEKTNGFLPSSTLFTPPSSPKIIVSTKNLTPSDSPRKIVSLPASFRTIPTNQEIAAVIFALAAIFDIIGALLSDSYYMTSLYISVFATYLYLFQAIVTLFGRRRYSIFPTDDIEETSFCSSIFKVSYQYQIVDCLNETGDFLFLIGSIIDVVIGCFYLNPNFEESVPLSYFSLASSVLWLLNALLYIAADYIYKKLQVYLDLERKLKMNLLI